MQEAAHRRKVCQAIEQESADAATRAAEAARRCTAKRIAAVAHFEKDITAVEDQLKAYREILAQYVAHEDKADAEHRATDQAAAAAMAAKLAAATKEAEEADLLVQAAGEAKALRPAAPKETPTTVMTTPADDAMNDDANDDLDSDGELQSDGGDGDADDGEVVEYLAPPEFADLTISETDLAAVVQARTRLCHWFVQPPRVILTFGALGLPVPTVAAMVGQAAWGRAYAQDAIVTPADAIPRSIGGVLMEAVAKLPEQARKGMEAADAPAATFTALAPRERPRKPAAGTARRPQNDKFAKQ